jgi:hypothetical protein
MYFEIIRQFHHTLGNLDAILEKAEAHAAERKFDVNNFLTARLAPDMLPFSVQIRIACDVAKGAAASLSGQVAPKHADDETTFAELRARIGKVRDYLAGFKAEDFAGTTATKLVPIPYPPGKFMQAQEYALGRQIPNFFFHVTTAYALLRAGGVSIGKVDYLGALNIVDG